jgi:hypothetical protein
MAEAAERPETLQTRKERLERLIKNEEGLWRTASTAMHSLSKARVQDKKRLRLEMQKHTDKIDAWKVELHQVKIQVEQEILANPPPEDESPTVTDDEEVGRQRALKRHGKAKVFDPTNQMNNLPPAEAEAFESGLNAQLAGSTAVKKLIPLAEILEVKLKAEREEERTRRLDKAKKQGLVNPILPLPYKSEGDLKPGELPTLNFGTTVLGGLILFNIRHNGRAPYERIAQSVGMTKTSVHNAVLWIAGLLGEWLDRVTAERRLRILPASGPWSPASIENAIGAIDGTHMFCEPKFQGGAGRRGTEGYVNMLTPFMRCHGKKQGPSMALVVACDFEGHLLWVSLAHPGATSDIKIVREDKLAEAFVLKREGQPDSYPTFLADCGLHGVGNTAIEGYVPNVLTPKPKKWIKTQEDREHNRALQHKRAAVERLFGRMHNNYPGMDQPLKASEATACLQFRGMVAMTGWTTENSALNAVDTRLHAEWQKQRAERLAAERGIPREDVEDWSSEDDPEPELEPVELTPEQVRDGRLREITQLHRVLTEFAQDDPVSAFRRWGELHPGNARGVKAMIEGLVRAGLGQNRDELAVEPEHFEAGPYQLGRDDREARLQFDAEHGDEDPGPDEAAQVARLKWHFEALKPARETRTRLQRRLEKETKQAEYKKLKLDEAVEKCAEVDHAAGKGAAKLKKDAKGARDKAHDAWDLAVQSTQKTRDDLDEATDNLVVLQRYLKFAREDFDLAVARYRFRVVRPRLEQGWNS